MTEFHEIEVESDPVVAMHLSTCEGCGDVIFEGDLIVPDDEGGWVHEGCV